MQLLESIFSLKYKKIFAPVWNTLGLFKLNLDFLQAVKVTKSSHHLFHDRASKGHGSIPGSTSLTSVYTRLERLTAMQIRLWRQTRNKPMPLYSLLLQPIKNSRFSLKRRRCKDLFKRKKYFGVRCTLTVFCSVIQHFAFFDHVPKGIHRQVLIHNLDQYPQSTWLVLDWHPNRFITCHNYALHNV